MLVMYLDLVSQRSASVLKPGRKLASAEKLELILLMDVGGGGVQLSASNTTSLSCLNYG